MKIYSLDIGGSSVKHCLIEINGNEIEIKSKSFPEQLRSNKFAELQEMVLSIIDHALKENNDVSLIGISTTGSVNTNNIVVSAGHFEGYTNINWAEIIQSKYSNIKKVVTVNDGRASAWAEFKSSNQHYKSHIHIVVGTGVGGGIVYNNELLLGDSGQAGYIGHMKITSEDTIKCSCGKTGCVETLASSRGIEDHMKKLSKSNEDIDFMTILELANQGDINAVNAIRKGGYWLGIGIGNSMNILNPSVVTIGGGVVSGASNLNSQEFKDVYMDSVFEGIEYSSHKRVFASCNVRIAQYGNDAGMIGAAFLCHSFCE